MQTLRLFTNVAATGSFSEAAKRHGLTQSAVSQRVGQLERELGSTLIDRSIRPLGLTEAGRVYLEGCEDVLQRYDQLEQRVRELSDHRRSAERLRVAAIYSAGIALLEQVQQAFETAHPHTEIELRYEKPDAIHQLVLHGEVDLGVLSYPERFKKVAVIGLHEEPMGLVCRPDHPLARHPHVRAEALDERPMVNFDTELPAGRAIVDYLKTHGTTPSITHSFDNIDTLKGAVAVTDRFAILPRRTVEREVAAGTLSVIELEPTLARPMGIIHSQVGRGGLPARSPAAATFVNLLKRHSSTGPMESRADSASSRPAPDRQLISVSA